MKARTGVALAIGVGYVLGRRRKLRPALTLAAAVAAGRASNGTGLLKHGRDLLGSSPLLSNLTSLGEPLATAGKAAATAAVGSGVDALSGRLRDKADALRGRTEPGEPEEKRKTRDTSGRDDDEDDESASWDEDEDEEDEDEDEADSRAAPRKRAPSVVRRRGR
jgi:hypothetical protein